MFIPPSRAARAVAVLLVGAWGCASAGGAGRGAEPPLAVIDAHTHTEFEGDLERSSKIPRTREEYFKEMREAGVVGAIAHTTESGGNYYDLRAQHVMHCGGVDAKVDAARLEAGLKSGQYGCIKIYLGYVHQWAYDAAYEPAYQLAERYDVPVVFHTGDTYSTVALVKYADPLTIDEVAVRHPKVRFVIAHCGNPWIQSAAEVAYKNPNVYLDGSAFMIGDLSRYTPEQLDRQVVQPLRWIFEFVDDPRKLMFGTDWPLVSMRAYLEVFKRAIPKEHWPAVLHDNAARVFKLR